MINRAILVGRLTKDPELRRTQSDIPVTSFTVAVNRTFKNQRGEQEADFINCVVWRRQAENVAQYVGKGSLVGIEGRIQSRSFDDQNGNRRFVTEIVADSVQFLEPKNQQGASSGYQQNTSYQGSSNHSNYNNNSYNNNQEPKNDTNNNSSDDLKDIDIAEDDLPF